MPSAFPLSDFKSTSLPLIWRLARRGIRSRSVRRGQLKCDGTRAETRFGLPAKRTSPFKSAGASVQSTTGNRSVLISGSNAGYTMFRSSVKGTGYPLHSPVSPSLPVPCVTVCHHISTGLYCTSDNNLQFGVSNGITSQDAVPSSFTVFVSVTYSDSNRQFIRNTRHCGVAENRFFRAEKCSNSKQPAYRKSLDKDCCVDVFTCIFAFTFLEPTRCFY